MEALTKRIIAIVIIAGLGVGGGLAAWYFLLAPGAGEYSWSSSDCPGAPSGISSDHIIKFGITGDVGEITGDGAWEGSYLAAKEINEEGGVVLNGTTYYIGVTKEDTDEANPNLVTSRGIAAAERLVYNKKVQFGIGGFRSEALLAYQEVFMDNEIIFVDTGAATDVFCENVRSWYTRYKYFWRTMPINSSSLGSQIFNYLFTMITVLNTTFTGEVANIGIIYEDLTWTEDLVAGVAYYFGPYGPIPAFRNMLKANIKYDVTLTAADMLTHVNTLIAADCDIVIPVISAQGGLMMMQHYATLHPNFLVIGIDVQSQLDTFWDQTNGDCLYEIEMQSIHVTNKTATTIPFWNAFRAEWGHDPLYTASGSYDALNFLVWAINETQSLRAWPDITLKMETATKENVMANPENFPGSVGGAGAFWPSTHDLVAGFPYGYTLWCQWQANATKVIMPSYGSCYVDSYLTNIGMWTLPPWLLTDWTT